MLYKKNGDHNMEGAGKFGRELCERQMVRGKVIEDAVNGRQGTGHVRW